MCVTDIHILLGKQFPLHGIKNDCKYFIMPAIYPSSSPCSIPFLKNNPAYH